MQSRILLNILKDDESTSKITKLLGYYIFFFVFFLYHLLFILTS